MRLSAQEKADRVCLAITSTDEDLEVWLKAQRKPSKWTLGYVFAKLA